MLATYPMGTSQFSFRVEKRHFWGHTLIFWPHWSLLKGLRYKLSFVMLLNTPKMPIAWHMHPPTSYWPHIHRRPPNFHFRLRKSMFCAPKSGYLALAGAWLHGRPITPCPFMGLIFHFRRPRVAHFVRNCIGYVCLAYC